MLTLLANKLHRPNPPIKNVPRSHLLRRLNDGLGAGHHLTLVSEPAGFGKTICISEWMDALDLPVSWPSILNKLCGDLCNAVAGHSDSHNLLEQRFNANLFLIPLDDEGSLASLTALPLIAIGLFCFYQAIANTIRALSDRPVHNPLSIQLLK